MAGLLFVIDIVLSIFLICKFVADYQSDLEKKIFHKKAKQHVMGKIKYIKEHRHDNVKFDKATEQIVINTFKKKHVSC